MFPQKKIIWDSVIYPQQIQKILYFDCDWNWIELYVIFLYMEARNKFLAVCWKFADFDYGLKNNSNCIESTEFFYFILFENIKLILL